jgi:folate-binding protein YgfZ
MVSLSHEEGYRALREGAGALALERDVVRAAGPDAEKYLQGQTSQDIAALQIGSSAWALVLAPQGKLDAFVRVHRAGPEEFLLVTDGGVGQALVARLNRFKLRTNADMDQLDWTVVAVRGPAAGQGLATSGPVPGTGCVAVPFEWGDLVGYDLVGPAPAFPAGVPEVGAEAYEAARIEAGFPRHGAELDERTVPAEAGLVKACVSFTKGCYTGQELVARIDSRGSNVPRHLRGLLLSGPAKPGSVLLDGRPGGAERPVAAGAQEAGSAEAKGLGRLTSVAFSPRLGWVALGYVGRGVEVGTSLLVAGGSGPGAAPGGTEPVSVLGALVADLPL